MVTMADWLLLLLTVTWFGSGTKESVSLALIESNTPLKYDVANDGVSMNCCVVVL
jgi:hypothetical protein